MSDSTNRRYIISIFDAFSQRKRDYPYSKTNKGEKGEENTNNLKPDPTSYYANNGKKERHEHCHRVQEKIFWVSYIVVSFLALVAACVAAYYAGSAFSQTRRQADAAVAANSPFVYRKFFELSHSKPADTANDSVSISAVWENTGSSPAVDMTVSSGCKILSFNGSEKDITIMSNSLANYSDIFGPKDRRPSGTCKTSINNAIAKQINAGTIKFFAFGRACYRDQNSPKKMLETEFIYQIESIPDLEQNLLFVPIGKRNCVDEKCADYEWGCGSNPR